MENRFSLNESLRPQNFVKKRYVHFFGKQIMTSITEKKNSRYVLLRDQNVILNVSGAE